MSKLLTAVLAATLLASCSSGPGAPKPDLVLITVDTLRADHLGPYREFYAGPEGPARVETPAIDEFAAASLVYAEAWTAIPITTASLGTILSGKLPRHHGALNNSGDMAEDVRTVVMALKEHGYDTAAFLPTFVRESDSDPATARAMARLLIGRAMLVLSAASRPSRLKRPSSSARWGSSATEGLPSRSLARTRRGPRNSRRTSTGARPPTWSSPRS